MQASMHVCRMGERDPFALGGKETGMGGRGGGEGGGVEQISLPMRIPYRKAALIHVHELIREDVESRLAVVRLVWPQHQHG